MRPTLLLALAVVACRPGHSRQARPDSAAAARPVDQSPVIREPTVVAFWLPASDTLKRGEGADLLDDFRAYTGAVSPLLDQQGIKLETTTADSIVVELPNGPRRIIRLSGLDYPFGYVLVEPGYPETILTGVSTDDELLEQVTWYFGLDEDSDSSDAPGVVRTSQRAGCHPERGERSLRCHPERSEGSFPCHLERSEGSFRCHPERSEGSFPCHPERSEGSLLLVL